MATNVRLMSAAFAALGATALPVLFAPTAAHADPPRDHGRHAHQDSNGNHRSDRDHDNDQDRGRSHTNYQAGQDRWHTHSDNGWHRGSSSHQSSWNGQNSHRDHNNRDNNRDNNHANYVSHVSHDSHDSSHHH